MKKRNNNPADLVKAVAVQKKDEHPLEQLNTKEAASSVLVFVTTEGHQFIGVNGGYIAEKQCVCVKRAGPTRSMSKYLDQLLMSEASLKQVRDPSPAEINDYLSSRRDLHWIDIATGSH